MALAAAAPPPPEGYDIVLLGQASGTNIDEGQLRRRFEHPAVEDAAFRSAAELLGTYAGQASDFREWLRDAGINRDRNLRLHYLAGHESERHPIIGDLR